MCHAKYTRQRKGWLLRAFREFLPDIPPLFMSLNRLIGCPVLWVLLIGSYKTKSFISLAQALPLSSVLNESDKGVLCLNFRCDSVCFFSLSENVVFYLEKTNYSPKKDKNVKCLSPTLFQIIHLTCGYRSHCIDLACLSERGDEFWNNDVIRFAGF